MFVYPRLPLVLKHLVEEQHGSSSMTKNAKQSTLLTHTLAHSTKPSFMPKTNNQTPKKFLSLVLS